MKRLFTLLMVILVAGSYSQLVAQGKPKIVFQKTEHNFGSFKESDGVQTTTFEFTNTGDAPLILNAVTASCGCTTPDWSRQPIAPGQKGTVKVAYNPANRPGAFSKTATVRSNAETAVVVLTISGRVEEREKTLAELYPREIGVLRAQRNHISFPTIKMSEVKTETLELLNDTDKPVSVGFRTVPPHIKATVNPATIPAKGKGVLTVEYDAKAANTYGFASHRIYLSLNGSNDYKSSIGISATIEEDFSALSAAEMANAPVVNFNTLSYDFGDIKQGEKKEYTFELANKGKRDLVIRNVRSSCGCTAVSPSKNVIGAGETAPIKVVFDSTGKKGRQSKTVTVITNDPKTPTTTLRVSTNII
ncbi:hypothetical protein BA6E_10195 [Bacteroidales bacterium 6E]|nr:hypothetical protein BA6E_10195 [Bacteroidales bacterium 6E]